MEQKDFCTVCLEPITDPLCKEHYIREMMSWMKDRGIHELRIMCVVKEIRKKIPELKTVENSKCVLCHKRRISICAYCFFLLATRALKNKKIQPELIEDFLETFNYQLGNERYPLNIR